MAMSGADWRIGREGRREFGELNAGVAFTTHAGGGSVFLEGSTGEASPRIPAMTWRMCFTTNASDLDSGCVWIVSRGFAQPRAAPRTAGAMPVSVSMLTAC